MLVKLHRFVLSATFRIPSQNLDQVYEDPWTMVRTHDGPVKTTCSKIRNMDSILFSISEFISDLMWTIIGCFKISGHTVDHFILSEHFYQMYF